MIDLFTPPLAPSDDPTGFIGSANGVVFGLGLWDTWDLCDSHTQDAQWDYEDWINQCENRSPNLSLPSSPCDLPRKQS